MLTKFFLETPFYKKGFLSFKNFFGIKFQFVGADSISALFSGAYGMLPYGIDGEIYTSGITGRPGGRPLRVRLRLEGSEAATNKAFLPEEGAAKGGGRSYYSLPGECRVRD